MINIRHITLEHADDPLTLVELWTCPKKSRWICYCLEWWAVDTKNQ